MRSVLLGQIRAHAARLIASTLAIVIAVGFVVATLVLHETARATVLEAVGAEYVDTGAVVTSDDGSSLADDAATLLALGSVRAVAPTLETSVQAVLPGRTGAEYLLAEAVAEDPLLQWQQLSAGVLPTAAGEVAVSDRTGAEVGDVLPVTSYDAEGRETAAEVTVVGVVDLGADPTAGLYGRVFVTADQAAAWGAADPPQLRVSGVDGTEPAALAAEVGAALAGQPVTVRTGEEQAEVEAAGIFGDAGVLTAVLLVFGTLAVLVAGLVIANTFAVLLAQRIRDLALLRCVGATAAQVRRSVLGEALATGVAASALGVLAGIGLAAGVSAVAAATDSPVPLSGVAVPVHAVVTGLLVGTLVTVLAALAPARSATRVSPLAALRPSDPAPLRSRPGVLRLVLGLVLLLPGMALLAAGVLVPDVLIALPGGALSFLGVVLLAQRAVPPVVAGAGRLVGRLGGVPAHLAAGNATRNPRRTAATATALLIGVTLTTAMVVGTASTRATVSAGLDAAYAADVVIDGGGFPIPPPLLDQLAAVDGVAGGVALLRGEVAGPNGLPVAVQGFDAEAVVPVLRSTADEPLPRLQEVVLPPWLADAWGVATGDPVELTSGERALTFAAVVGTDDVLAPRVTAVELAALVPDAPVGQLWLRLTDGGDQAAAVDEITDLAGTSVPTAQVIGYITERQAIDSVLDALLLVVTGLLGVAVVIALIGVGNTLALSVVERRQESGLLRALGLTRGQLRGLLAWEAVLVAGVAAVLGVGLGSMYGLAGAAAMLGELGDVVLAVPWLQVGAIVGVATLAGLLASVLPARRAARTPPVAAIAG